CKILIVFWWNHIQRAIETGKCVKDIQERAIIVKSFPNFCHSKKIFVIASCTQPRFPVAQSG
ncbi:hypothetical protein TNIN_211921, partial [Trichonephila inaurata madagascariensis]